MICFAIFLAVFSKHEGHQDYIFMKFVMCMLMIQYLTYAFIYQDWGPVLTFIENAIMRLWAKNTSHGKNTSDEHIFI